MSRGEVDRARVDDILLADVLDGQLDVRLEAGQFHHVMAVDVDVSGRIEAVERAADMDLILVMSGLDDPREVFGRHVEGGLPGLLATSQFQTQYRVYSTESQNHPLPQARS
jgi:ammonia channel protein AmtB